MATDGAAPARRMPRRARVIALIACAVALYLAVIVLYAFSGRSAGIGTSGEEPPAGGVMVDLVPQSVDAVGQRMTMALGIRLSPELSTADGVAPKETVNLFVEPVTGVQSLEYQADRVPAVETVTVLTDGVVENWPFDAYRVDDLLLLAYVTHNGVREPVPTAVHMSGSVQGWNIDARLDTAKMAQSKLPAVDVTATRSGSTVAFALVLLALLVTMPVLVLFVAIVAYRGTRKIEPSFLGWMGAMLFATVPLRGFLPGSPPIGSWIDYLIVLWVVAGLIVGLVIYILAWWRWGAPARGAQPPPPGG